MNLLELARKWLNPKTPAPETDAEFQERDAFNKRAGEIWLEYHDNELWAQRKLAAGLNLTPEGLTYMENEINARRLQKEADERLKSDAETTNEQEQERLVDGERRSEPAVRTEPSGAGTSGDGTYRPEQSPVASAETGGHAGGSELAGK